MTTVYICTRVYVQGVSIGLYMYTCVYVQGAGLCWNSPGGTASEAWLSLTLPGMINLGAYPKTKGEMSCTSMIMSSGVLYTGYTIHSVSDVPFSSK